MCTKIISKSKKHQIGSQKYYGCFFSTKLKLKYANDIIDSENSNDSKQKHK